MLKTDNLKAFFEKNKLPVILLAVSLLGICLLTLCTAEEEGSEDTSALEKSTAASIRAMAERISGTKTYVTVSIDCLYSDEYARNEDGGMLSVNGKPVLIKSELPRLRGVTVVCQNGSDPQIRSSITEAICCAYGIGSNKVCVVSGSFG